MKTKGIKMFTKIPMKTSIYMSYLIYHGQVNISKIVKIYPNHAPRGIYRHCKQDPTEKVDNRKFKADLKSFWPGMSNLQSGVLEYCGKKFAITSVQRKLQSESGIDHVCDRTIRRWLNKNDYCNSPLKKYNMKQNFFENSPFCCLLYTFFGDPKGTYCLQIRMVSTA